LEKTGLPCFLFFILFFHITPNPWKILDERHQQKMVAPPGRPDEGLFFLAIASARDSSKAG
jgi:hypothetical protein